MEHELRFGLDLGRLALLKKKIRSIMNNFRGRFFHVFTGKKIENKKFCSVRTKKLHKVKFKKYLS